MNFWIHRLLCLPSVFFSLRIEKDCFLRVGEFFIFGCLRQFFWGDFALCGARPRARLACRLGRCCCFAAVSTGHPHPMDPAASPKAGETFINATAPTKTTAANQNNYCSKLAAVFLYAMYQHSDMQPLDIVTACRNALYTSDTFFSDYCTIQDCKAACSGRARMSLRSVISRKMF